MSNEQRAVNLLREQYKQSFEWFLGTMQGVTTEVAHHVPAGNVSSIAGQAAHAVSGLDFLVVNAVAGKAPLIMSSHAQSNGISEPPPQGADWAEWGRTVKVDVPAFQDYTKAVFAEVENCLTTLKDSELDRELDLPFGKFSVAWVFNIMLLNTICHTGEIACLKGLQGLKGYPM
jgi:hypothetical protein